MASPLRLALLLAALSLAMSSVLCARFGLRERPRPRPPPPPTPAPTPAPTVDFNDVDVQRVLNFAMHEYNRMNKEKYLRRPLRLLSARKEIVDGINYFLEVEIGKTICTMEEANNYGWFRCPFYEQKEERRCRFMLQDRPWVDSTTLMSTKCHYSLFPDIGSRL